MNGSICQGTCLGEFLVVAEIMQMLLAYTCPPALQQVALADNYFELPLWTSQYPIPSISCQSQKAYSLITIWVSPLPVIATVRMSSPPD